MKSIVLLSSWILASILENVEPRSSYASDILIKRFIQYRGPNNCSIKYTPLVRIIKFMGLTLGGELVALVNDSTHMIAVLFTREAMEKFESRYGQRLTFEANSRLVIFREANLRFVNRHNEKDFAVALRGIKCDRSRGNSLLYLEVNEVEFFSRDQHIVSDKGQKDLTFVYVNAEYKQMFMASNQKGLKMGPPESSVGFNDYLPDGITDVGDYDGMVSEYEEEDSIAMITNG